MLKSFRDDDRRHGIDDQVLPKVFPGWACRAALQRVCPLRLGVNPPVKLHQFAISPQRDHLCTMSTVTEIEAAIEKLPSADLSELLAWLDDYRAMLGASETLFAIYDEEEKRAGAASQAW